MRQEFRELVKSYAEANGLEWECPEHACQARLSVDEYSFELALVEEAGRLLVQTGVGLLPPHDREGLLLALLAANNLFAGSFGMTLGLDAAQDLITIQAYRDMDSLSQEKFALLMDNMAQAAERWLIALYSGEFAAPDGQNAAASPENDGTVPPGFFMRV